MTPAALLLRLVLALLAPRDLGTIQPIVTEAACVPACDTTWQYCDAGTCRKVGR